MGRNQVSGYKHINGLIAKRNCGVQAHQIFQLLTAVSGLLLQFPVSALNFRFLRRIQFPRRNLQSLPVQGITVLTYHKKLTVICHSYYSRSSVMMNIIPVSLMTIRDHGILVYL